MAKGKDKPKSAAKVTRNANRRNGKAFKKHPVAAEKQTDKGGFMGYSRKRLLKMAAEKGTIVELLMEEMAVKRDDRKARKNKAFRSPNERPGIGEVTYKMTSVHRHFDKGRPYPCVPKGLKHAGKPDKKTDRRTEDEKILAAA